MIKKIYQKKKKIKDLKNNNKINHQRFNSHNKMNNLDFDKINKLTVSLPKSEKSKSNKKKDVNLKYKTKYKDDNNKILKFKTTIDKNNKPKKSDKKRKLNSKYNFKNIYNSNKFVNGKKKNIKTKPNKFKTKSVCVFKNLTKNYFENVCNLKIKNSKLTELLNKELLLIKMKFDSQKKNLNEYFNQIIENFEILKIKANKNLEVLFEESNIFTKEIIDKINIDKKWIDNLLEEYNKNKILDNSSLNKLLKSFNIKYKFYNFSNNNKMLDKFKMINYEELKKNLKNFNKIKNIKGIKDYNKSIEKIKNSILNNYKQFYKINELNNNRNNSNKLNIRKKGYSLSMAFGDFFISQNKLNKNNQIKNKWLGDDLKNNNNKKEKFMVLSSLKENGDSFLKKENFDENKINCNSISLKCSEELEIPINEFI